jgi:hypothetical protein
MIRAKGFPSFKLELLKIRNVKAQWPLASNSAELGIENLRAYRLASAMWAMLRPMNQADTLHNSTATFAYRRLRDIEVNNQSAKPADE